MSILQELLALAEAPNVPIELKDVIEAFPKQHGKALSKLWGGKRLVWHGMPFFADGTLGKAYTMAEEAAEAYIGDGYNVDAHMNLNFNGVQNNAILNAAENGLDWEMTYDVQFSKDEKQECYLGYDPRKDVLFIGFDAWASDEEFNSAWDKLFEDQTGQQFDMDDPDHEALYNFAWKEYQSEKMGFWGLCFEISDDDGVFTAEEACPPMTGGFYRDMRKFMKQQYPHIIDLRLD